MFLFLLDIFSTLFSINLIFFFSTCSDSEVTPENVNTLRKLLLLEDGQPRIFGHRGGQYEAPENTVLAIETAAKNGATAVEIDLEFTKDGVPVIFNDDDVDRCTDGHGPVSSYTHADLVKLNTTAHFNYTLYVCCLKKG